MYKKLHAQNLSIENDIRLTSEGSRFMKLLFHNSARQRLIQKRGWQTPTLVLSLGVYLFAWKFVILSVYIWYNVFGFAPCIWRALYFFELEIFKHIFDACALTHCMELSEHTRDRVTCSSFGPLSPAVPSSSVDLCAKGFARAKRKQPKSRDPKTCFWSPAFAFPENAEHGKRRSVERNWTFSGHRKLKFFASYFYFLYIFWFYFSSKNFLISIFSLFSFSFLLIFLISFFLCWLATDGSEIRVELDYFTVKYIQHRSGKG